MGLAPRLLSADSRVITRASVICTINTAPVADGAKKALGAMDVAIGVADVLALVPDARVAAPIAGSKATAVAYGSLGFIPTPAGPSKRAAAGRPPYEY